ncbi:MAG: hypothetical protein K2V38_00435, partial [Gemmataceae bacterium]|nr:hypothetical protein [Gemmataceae bacterium]
MPGTGTGEQPEPGTRPNPGTGTQPQPGTGTQPQPGTGVQPGDNGAPGGDANLKVKIDPFQAAAFDTDKSEVYTFSERLIDPITRKGELRRYSYPDFKVVKSRLKLPTQVSRAVIDPKAGKLYAATVTSTRTQLRPDEPEFNRTLVVGNIAIYDLKPIQDGKTADGKILEDNAELKPVKEIPLARPILAMELSADGKSLYVLTTVGTGLKQQSAILTIDTEKQTKGAEKTLSERTRDMVRTADGKGLLLVADMHQKNQTTAVPTFDPVAQVVAQNPVIFPGAVMDLVPGGADTFLASVQTVGMGGAGGNPGGDGQPGGGDRPIGPGGVIGQPGGGLGGQPTGLKFKLHVLDGKGEKELTLAGSPASNGGHIRYDAENKKLYVSSFMAAG